MNTHDPHDIGLFGDDIGGVKVLAAFDGAVHIAQKALQMMPADGIVILAYCSKSSKLARRCSPEVMLPIKDKKAVDS